MSSARDSTRVGFLARLTRRHLPLFLADVLTGIVFFLLNLIPGLALREYLNALPHEKAGWAIPWVPLIAYVAFKIANAVGAAAWMAIDTVFRYRVYDDVRMRLTHHLIARPSAVPQPVPIGDLLSRYRDDTIEVAEVLGKRGLQLVTSSIALSATTLAVLFSVSVNITVLAVLPVLGISVTAFLASRRLKALQQQTRQTAGDVSSILRECFAGIETIKVTNAGPHVLAHVRGVNNRRRDAAVLNGTFGEILASSQNIVIVLGTALVMWVAAGQMDRGTFGVGDFAYFVYALGTMGTLVDAFGRFISQFQRFTVTTQRLAQLLPTRRLRTLNEHRPQTSTPQPMAEPPSAELVISRLSYDHPDGTPALRDISLTARAGDLVLITGPVGSGKTTLLRTIIGVLPPTSGTIAIDGHTNLRGSVFAPPLASYTPQVAHVFSESLAENVLLGSAVEKLWPALNKSALDLDIPRLADGAQTSIGPRGHRLSGGQLHRLAAARMFAHPATVLLIDDLSASLDTTTEQVVLTNLLAECQNNVLIVVSNRQSVRKHASHIITLLDGRLHQTVNPPHPG